MPVLLFGTLRWQAERCSLQCRLLSRVLAPSPRPSPWSRDGSSGGTGWRASRSLDGAPAGALPAARGRGAGDLGDGARDGSPGDYPWSSRSPRWLPHACRPPGFRGPCWPTAPRSRAARSAGCSPIARWRSSSSSRWDRGWRPRWRSSPIAASSWSRISSTRRAGPRSSPPSARCGSTAVAPRPGRLAADSSPRARLRRLAAHRAGGTAGRVRGHPLPVRLSEHGVLLPFKSITGLFGLRSGDPWIVASWPSRSRRAGPGSRDGVPRGAGDGADPVLPAHAVRASRGRPVVPAGAAPGRGGLPQEHRLPAGVRPGEWLRAPAPRGRGRAPAGPP